MRIKSWEEFYDSGPRSLRDMLRWGVTHGGMVDELARLGAVLEVGTGSGMMSALLSKFCSLTVTIDTSDRVLARAGEVLDRFAAPVARVRGDGFRLPFAGDSFSACFSQGLLEHFGDGDAVRLVAEQLRVAPLAYVSVPSFFYPRAGRRGPGLVGNERMLTRAGWERILRRPEWRLESSYYADPKIASFAGITAPWPAQLLIKVGRAG